MPVVGFLLLKGIFLFAFPLPFFVGGLWVQGLGLCWSSVVGLGGGGCPLVVVFGVGLGGGLVLLLSVLALGCVSV